MVIIKTLKELPERCYLCPCFNQIEKYCQADKENRSSDYRPFWCPLEKERENTKCNEDCLFLKYINSIANQEICVDPFPCQQILNQNQTYKTNK